MSHLLQSFRGIWFSTIAKTIKRGSELHQETPYTYKNLETNLASRSGICTAKRGFHIIFTLNLLQKIQILCIQGRRGSFTSLSEEE